MVDEKPSRSFLAERLGMRIAALRKARNWTQAGLAERVGVETETVSRFERGATLPSLMTLETVSRVLEVGVGELLAETSLHPSDQAQLVSAWLAELGERDRAYVIDLVKRACEHLRSGAPSSG
jgi:transcriptional regulator with XRE-family HTH domain